MADKTLAEAAYEAYWSALGGEAADWPRLGPNVRAAWEASASAVAAAERKHIYTELGNEHFVIFTEDRFTVEHSVECKLSGRMHECEYHTAVRVISDHYDPGRLGRWRITGISEGLPELERADD